MKTNYLALICLIFIFLISLSSNSQRRKPFPIPIDESSCVFTKNSQIQGCTGDQMSSLTNYNCHQYVRAALIKKCVDLETGEILNNGEGDCQTSESQFSINSLNSSSNINSNSNDRFIKVCNEVYADAISFTEVDHAAIILRKANSNFPEYASTDDEGYPVVRHQCANYGLQHLGATEYEYFAVLPEISGVSTLGDFATATYAVNIPNFVSPINGWSVDQPEVLEIISQNDGTVNVRAKCNASSVSNKVTLSLTVKANETNDIGVMKKEITVTCYNACSGTLNGQQLQSYNNVTQNAANKAVMNASGWNWSKSWGTTNYWYTKNNGKELYFSIPTSCATFYASKPDCSVNYIFCAYGGYSSNKSINPDQESHLEPYKLYDIRTGRLVKKGHFDPHKNDKEILQDIEPGFYVIHIGESKQKIIVN